MAGRFFRTTALAGSLHFDYDRGLVIEATMQYAVGTIDLAQNYAPVNDAWVLTYQYTNIPSLGSTLEISYSKITLAALSDLGCHPKRIDPYRPYYSRLGWQGHAAIEGVGT